MFNIKKKSFKKFDFTLLFTTLILCAYGLIVINSATLSLGPQHYLKSQIASIIIGLIAILILSMMDYKFLGKLYIPIYIACNLILVAVLLFGFGEDQWGARSWMRIGPVTFQPAEFVKIGMIICLAKFIDNNKDDINQPLVIIKILAFAFLPILLILRQPDAGTAMVFIFFTAIMLFIAGLDWKYIGYAFGAFLVSLPIIWFNLAEFQKNRVFDFLHPERDPMGSGYQAMQGKIAIGSGKFWGRGLYEGVQTQYNYIPEKQNDFIFSVLAEELGFVGGFILILLYIIFMHRFIKIARESRDLFGSLLAIGLVSMSIFHIWENIGMNIGIMPITGIPLPFISHGGTFLLINLIGVGIALSIGMENEGLKF